MEKWRRQEGGGGGRRGSEPEGGSLHALDISAKWRRARRSGLPSRGKGGGELRCLIGVEAPYVTEFEVGGPEARSHAKKEGKRGEQKSRYSFGEDSNNFPSNSAVVLLRLDTGASSLWQDIHSLLCEHWWWELALSTGPLCKI